MKIFIIILFFATNLWIFSCTKEAEPQAYPAQPSDYVKDMTGKLSPAEIKAAGRLLRERVQATTNQIFFLVAPNTGVEAPALLDNCDSQ